jgi:hypothetical protein
MVRMAARMIDTDTTPESSLAVCHVDRGGCGWRSPVFRSRAKALAAADAHREAEHAELATEARGVARRREGAAA